MGGNSGTLMQLYKIARFSSFSIVALLFGEILVYALLPRASTALEHFQIYHDNWLLGLLSLDLLGMISYLLFIPLMIAMYFLLNETNMTWILISMILFVIGIIDFYSTNTAFSMLAISNQYSEALSEAEKTIYLSVGETLINIFNENAFLVSYFIVSLAWTIIGFIMWKSKVFNKFSSVSGIIAGASGIIAIVFEHALSKNYLAIAILFYFNAIVFLLIWILLIGLKLNRLIKAYK